MRTKLFASAACAIAMMVAAGCGSSGSSSSSQSSGGASTQNAAATASSTAPAGAAIRVGMICSCSGGQSDALGRSGDVAKAWASSVNAAGGINGHAVKLYVLDDGGVASTALQDAKQLVEQDKVIAIVGTTSSNAAEWASYVQSKGVPVVGGNPFLAPFASNPDFFPTGSSVPIEILGLTKIAKAAGATNVGVVYCAETPVCATLGPLAQGIGKLTDVKVETGKAAVSQPNFTALCLTLKSAGATAMAVAQSAPTVSRVHASCAQQGYNPLPLNFASGSSPLWLKDPNLNGKMLMVANEGNYQDTSIPAVPPFNAALDKYLPGYRQSAQFALSGSWDTWLGGLLFQAAAKAANIGPSSTAADVTKGLYALKNETLDGATMPLTFTAGKPTFLTCYFVIGIKGGQYTSPNGTAPICLSPTELAGLGKILAG
jgi:branched-chain amino acid transport system substrate-binding protein